MINGLRFDVLTLFPEMLGGFVASSMVGRAVKQGLIEVGLHNLRDWATGKWKVTDDRPFGGGAGMLLKPEPLFAAIDELRTPEAVVVYLSPDGERLSTPLARELSHEKHLVLVSGHYEGIDERVREARIDREISIGDYVLTNGTLPAAVLIDAVSRQIPGVLGEEKSLTQDSFSSTFLGFPQYTRPVEYAGMRVPEVLLSGNHAAIQQWRRERQIERTRQRRPDLLSTDNPS
ncbi:MAG: tRNA (guanosine(37)-N1)-methyltransferase TrmD [Verrucomicrobiota bacterium]